MSKCTTPPAEARKVVVLGAGASAADGVPLQAGLFAKYAEIMRRKRDDLLHPSSEADLRTFFGLFWGVDLDSDNLAAQHFPTFEEALGLLEMADSRGEFFRNFGALQTEATRAQELRAHLTNLIATVLDHSTTTRPQEHVALIRHLQKTGWLDKTDFISLNYDLLLDNASRAVLGVEPDYHVEFSSITEDCLPGGTNTWKPRLLKIHGSLNWLYCPACSALDLFPGEKIVAQILREPTAMTCHRCQEPRVPILVPPTFFKVMSNFYLQQTWRKAEELLRNADHLIFCGYSFPDADLHFKYLLKREEINRYGLHGTPTELPVSEAFPPEHIASSLEVFIVNEHAGKQPLDRKAEQSRFLRFFRDKPLVHWTKLSFAEFAANPAAYADPANWT